MIISVIIPAYNAERTLPACLNALKNQQGIEPSAYEIIVVDDGSTDNTASICKDEAAVRLISVQDQPDQEAQPGQQGSKGASTARNCGIRAAKGEIVCFTDADCEPTAYWLHNLVQPLKDDDIAGCKGIYATKQTAFMARFIQIEYEDKYDRLRSQSRIDFIDTYSAAYRRHILVENGGFDELFHYAEDVEMSFRLTNLGYQFVFQPDAVVYHKHPDKLRTYLNKKFWNGYWRTQTIRRFPERAVTDSHTPQTLKIQIVLMALLLATTAVTLFSLFLNPAITYLALFLWLSILFTFLLTTIPFARKAWPKDKQVALASPIVMGARSLALGFGTASGLLRPNQDIFGKQTPDATQQTPPH